MATTITFVIKIVMKGRSPPSIMCTTTMNTKVLKHNNDIIIMKMLHKRKCTSPNKPYFTPSPSVMMVGGYLPFMTMLITNVMVVAMYMWTWTT